MNNKSSENFDAANLLVRNSMFSASIHCYYYSCFQLSKYMLKKSGISYRKQDAESTGRSSHSYVIEKTADILNDNSRLQCLDYNTNMSKLKKMRKKADYTIEKINEEETRNAQNWSTKVNKILNTIITK